MKLGSPPTKISATKADGNRKPKGASPRRMRKGGIEKKTADYFLLLCEHQETGQEITGNMEYSQDGHNGYWIPEILSAHWICCIYQRNFA